MNWGNYNGTTLLNVVYKMVPIFVKNKLTIVTRRIIGKYQACLLKRTSVTVQIHTIKEVQERGYESQTDTRVLSLDFQQECDKILRRQHIETQTHMRDM